jgi:hypothetical protein
MWLYNNIIFLFYYIMYNEDIKYCDELNLPIKKFKLEKMKLDSSILLMTKNNIIKCSLCDDILKYYKNKIPFGLVISKTNKFKESFYSEFFPDNYIHYKFDSKILHQLFNRQLRMIENENKKKCNVTINSRVLLLMDNCLSNDIECSKNKEIYELMNTYRCYKITFILTIEDPTVKYFNYVNNFDYSFLFETDNEIHKKIIYEKYSNIFKNINEFKTIFKKLTLDNQAMVISNLSNNILLNEKVFWFKSSNIKK